VDKLYEPDYFSEEDKEEDEPDKSEFSVFPMATLTNQVSPNHDVNPIKKEPEVLFGPASTLQLKIFESMKKMKA